MNTVLNLDKQRYSGRGSRFSEVVSEDAECTKSGSENHMQIYVESERGVETY